MFVAVLSGTAVVVFGPQLTIAGMLLIFAVALCWVKPALYMQGLLVVGLVLPAGFTTTQIFSIQISKYNVLYTDVLLGIVVLRWIMGQISGRRHSLTVGVVSRRLLALIAVLLIYSVFSLIRGLLEYGRFAQSMYDARPVFYYLVILIAFDYLQTQQDMERLSKSILIGLALYSSFVLSYFLAPVDHPLSAAQELNAWAYANRIGFSNGAYLILGIPMTLWLLMSRRMTMYAKIWIFFALIAFIAVLVLSMSRTTALTLVLSIILSHIVYSRAYHNRTRMSILVVRLFLITSLVLIGILIAIDHVIPLVLGESGQYTLETFARRFDLSSATAYEAYVAPRIVMLRTAVSLILQNPILGYGMGYQFGLLGWSGQVTFVDNSFLTIWIRLGLVGFLSLIVLIGLLFQSTRRLLRLSHLPDSPYARILIVSWAGGAIPLLILSLNTSWLVTSSAVIPLLIIAGAIVGFSTQHERESIASHS
ncbi:MAG: hypothetical protein AMXMBFR16_11900 [Candidatus Uhrbacteria bacterium]